MGRSGSQVIRREQILDAAGYEAPSGDLEQRIAALFAETLGVDRVGANDDFFDLGGDSLSGEALATGISRETGKDFKISLLVERSTPRKVANSLADPSAGSFPFYQRPPIFMVHGLGGFMFPRPEFLSVFAQGQKFRMFELPGLRDGNEILESIPDIAAEYVRQLQEEHPSGPILLGAYCGGAIIALEMAEQLAERGRSVKHLVLLDPAGVPINILDNFLRRKFGPKGPLMRRRERFDPRWGWLGRQGRKLQLLWHLGRWTDGSNDADLIDERFRRFNERAYSERFRSSREFKRAKHRFAGVSSIAQFRISKVAQARFRAALHQYLPRPFTGTVLIFCSEELRWRLEEPTSIWPSLFPNRDVRILAQSHSEAIAVREPEQARILQSAFDELYGPFDGTAGATRAPTHESSPTQPARAETG